jgi:glyoxylase-like metal-dependent hydrolase (beta-lactamase superfamily II)
VFVGDSVFNPDLGSGRADFPGGSAEHLFDSCRRLFSLPDHVRIWVGHDYPPEGGRPAVAHMSVGQQRQLNKHLKDGIAQEDFVRLRQERDAALADPKLIHQSLQMNIRAGRLPKPTESGQRVLHMPLVLDCLEW